MVFATPPPAFFPAVAFNGSSCFLAGAEVSEDTGALTLIWSSPDLAASLSAVSVVGSGSFFGAAALALAAALSASGSFASLAFFPGS